MFPVFPEPMWNVKYDPLKRTFHKVKRAKILSDLPGKTGQMAPIGNSCDTVFLGSRYLNQGAPLQCPPIFLARVVK